MTRLRDVRPLTISMLLRSRWRIAELALRNRLPSIFSTREYAQAGGLMSYGENLSDFYRRAASFVDKIFKGDGSSSRCSAARQPRGRLHAPLTDPLQSDMLHQQTSSPG